MFEPVSHQNRLSVRRFDDVLQSIELPVMAIAVMEIADIAAVPLLIYASAKRNR